MSRRITITVSDETYDTLRAVAFLRSLRPMRASSAARNAVQFMADCWDTQPEVKQAVEGARRYQERQKSALRSKGGLRLLGGGR